MNDGAADGQPSAPYTRWRSLSLISAGVVVIVALVPPLSAAARHYEYAAALQFSLLAIVAPELLVVGAPWRLLGLARRPGSVQPGPLDAVGSRRQRHRELWWSLVFLACDVAAVFVWRTPAAVAAVSHHRWLAPLEALSLLVFGIGLWLELVQSPPLVPRSGPLRRAVLSAIVMWAFWIDAYVVGLSNDDWYRNFHHVAGHGLSAAADQQVAAVILWFAAAVSFVPVIFWNALNWLRSEDDPDAELATFNRLERRRAVPPPRRHGGTAPTP